MQFNNSRYTQILHGILIVLLTGVLALAVLTQANPGLTLPDRDYGDRAYTGQQILLGKLPYKDISLGKPPAIYYLNALGLWAAHGLRWGIWAIEFICLAAAILLSYILIKKLWGVFPALCGILIWTYGLNITMGGGNNTEEFPLPLHFLSLILFLNLIKSPRNYLNNLLVGLAFGISFLFRENNAAIETAIVLVLLIIQLGRKDFRTIFTQLIWMAAGVLIPVLITITYFWSQGIVKQMYGGSVTAPLTYSETKFSGLPAGLGGFQVLGIVGWISLIGFSIALILWIRHRRDESSALLLLLVIGFPLTVVTSDLAQRSYPHYFINWLPFVALLSGLIFYVILKQIDLVSLKAQPVPTFSMRVLRWSSQLSFLFKAAKPLKIGCRLRIFSTVPMWNAIPLSLPMSKIIHSPAIWFYFGADSRAKTLWRIERHQTPVNIP